MLNVDMMDPKSSQESIILSPDLLFVHLRVIVAPAWIVQCIFVEVLLDFDA